MKRDRVFVAVALILIGIVTITFGDQKLSEKQRRAAITACNDKFVECGEHCLAYKSNERAWLNCNDECMRKFDRCLDAVWRRWGKPPTPTPAKK
jgi:hypothetical protein